MNEHHPGEQPTNEQQPVKSGIARRGFASMNPERRREISRQGGIAISSDRRHMAEIGRKGGKAGNKSSNDQAPYDGQSYPDRSHEPAGQAAPQPTRFSGDPSAGSPR